MIGKTTRLARLFRGDGKTVVIALDHAQFKGPMDGLQSMSTAVQQAAEGGADGIILNPGALQDCVSHYAGRCALVLRITGASTDGNPTFDYHRSIATVKRAASLGADAVIAMGFLGGPGEAASLALLAKLAADSERWGMPLVAEMLIADPAKFNDIPSIARGARVAYELGADVVKVYGAGDPAFAAVPKGCPLPVLVAGGASAEDPVAVARGAVRSGAAGVAFGRTVFGAKDPVAVVHALVAAVHGAKGGPCDRKA
ncbi:MAG: fructose-bisphosphate aldolase [Candidatus Bipolaricaulis sp.]|nr:fructose-bisphosphate aldolase [Candidatus Bipolaricaulis sp.]